jgi:hypothetical protein
MDWLLACAAAPDGFKLDVTGDGIARCNAGQCFNALTGNPGASSYPETGSGRSRPPDLRGTAGAGSTSGGAMRPGCFRDRAVLDDARPAADGRAGQN